MNKHSLSSSINRQGFRPLLGGVPFFHEVAKRADELRERMRAEGIAKEANQPQPISISFELRPDGEDIHRDR